MCQNTVNRVFNWRAESIAEFKCCSPRLRKTSLSLVPLLSTLSAMKGAKCIHIVNVVDVDNKTDTGSDSSTSLNFDAE